MPKTSTAAETLVAHALAFPAATEHFPWGERAIKVAGKTFLFTNATPKGGGLTLSVKLPESSFSALSLPFAAPTRYGLGKSGWVTFSFGPRDKPPVELLRVFIGESYQAVAPKKLLRTLPEAAVAGPAKKAKGPKRRV